MTLPLVLAVGVEATGSAVLQWSARKHMRQIHYAVASADREALLRSGITKKILFQTCTKPTASEFNPSIQSNAVLTRALIAVDICVMIAALENQADCEGAIAIAESAKERNIPCVCICILPVRGVGPEIDARVAKTLDALAKLSDVTFLAPLERLALDPSEIEISGAECLDLFEYIDRLIQLASASRLSNLILQAATFRTRSLGEAGLYRRILLPDHRGQIVAVLAEMLNSDPFIYEEQLADARFATVIVQSREGPTPSVLADVAAGMAAILPPTTDLELVARANPDCGDSIGVELLCLTPAPADLSKWGRPHSPSSEWVRFMPWLDRGLRAPIGTTFEGLFGLRFTSPLDNHHDSARPQSSETFAQTRSRRSIPSPGSFTSGSTLHWLDEALTTVETLILGMIRIPAQSFGLWLKGDGRLRDHMRAIRSVMASIWQHRRASPLWDIRSMIVLITLAVLPLCAANLGLADIQAMARAGRLTGGSKVDVIGAFRNADQFRIVSASVHSRTTLGVYKTMGLAATFPSARASHLDAWAIGQDYLKLNKFQATVPPFAFVQSNDVQKVGQVGIVTRYLQEVSSSPANALSALGLSQSAPELARLTGESEATAVGQLYEIDANAGTGGDLRTVMGLAGCNTIRNSLAKHFGWKLQAPAEVKLTDRHYFLNLALSGSASCRDRLNQAIRGADLLKEFQSIAYVRHEPTGKAGLVRYDIVVPVAISSEASFEGDLGFYLTGLRAFYLLDFERAQAAFDNLENSSSKDAATLGAFMRARVSFWHHEFDRGSYRPDLFVPWRYLTDDPDGIEGPPPGKRGNADAGHKIAAGEVPRCGKDAEAAEEAVLCRLAERQQPAEEILKTYDPKEVKRLKAILIAIEKNPIIRPGLVRDYLGEGGDESEDPQ